MLNNQDVLVKLLLNKKLFEEELLPDNIYLKTEKILEKEKNEIFSS